MEDKLTFEIKETVSGRFSSSKPNMQQVHKEEIKAPFYAEDAPEWKYGEYPTYEKLKD